MAQTLGSHDANQPATDGLGFPGGGFPGGGFPGGGLPGGGLPGGNLDFSPGSFNFGSSRFEIQPGGTFNFGSNFSFGQDILGQLPTGLSQSQLPSFSQNDYPGQGGQNLKWTDLVKQLLKLGPAYIEAYRKGSVDAPASAPRQAQSQSTQDRQAALRRAIARIERERSQEGGGGGGGDGMSSLAGINATTALLGAGVAASIVLSLRS